MKIMREAYCKQKSFHEVGATFAFALHTAVQRKRHDMVSTRDETIDDFSETDMKNGPRKMKIEYSTTARTCHYDPNMRIVIEIGQLDTSGQCRDRQQ